MKPRDMEPKSQIEKFFKNQTIFLTGGSGFLGKILIEKLVRECEGIIRIYVLMRPNKNKTPEQRFNELFDYACFDVLKSKDQSLLKKVRLVNGDCLQANLGLSDQDISVLQKETTCVIHAAANVKFDQSLKEASCYVRATRDLLEIAKKMLNLKVFTFISTAYSNCVFSHIKEEFYEPPMKPEQLLQLVDALDDDTCRAITPELLGTWPNTYVFSKSISEHLLKTVGRDLPVTIVRPAIVLSSSSEPMPGWIDNFYGVFGISVGAVLGVIKSLHCKPDIIPAIVPADYATNCTLAATWKRGTSDTTTIYNFIGHKNNQITWEQSVKIVRQYYWKVIPEKLLWYQCFELRENKYWHQFCVFFLHTVVGYVVDFVLLCLGRPTLAVKNYKRLNRMLDTLSYFSTNSWTFQDDNVMELWKNLHDEDKTLFCFNMEQFDYNTYLYNCSVGARLYLLKETPDTLPRALKKARILFVLHYTIIAIFWYILYKFIIFVLGLIF